MLINLLDNKHEMEEDMFPLPPKMKQMRQLDSDTAKQTGFEDDLSEIEGPVNPIGFYQSKNPSS